MPSLIMVSDPDIVIVGSGMGGATLAYALRDSGAQILVLERGDFLPSEPENWDATAVFRGRRYQTDDRWYTGAGKPFAPETHYVVGGNTKVYGATLPRFRASDFETTDHAEGVSPGWPISYGVLAPFYAEAERLYGVHGSRDEDPTDPDRTDPFPEEAIDHEPAIQELAERLTDQGLRPYHLPLGVDAGRGGGCILCRTCDGFPCKLRAKHDAETASLRRAMERPNVSLRVRTQALQLITDATGKRVEALTVSKEGTIEQVRAGTFVLACGAVNSAALLLRSANDRHPHGLANASDQVGRNYMAHVNTVMMSLNVRRANPTTFQKTLGVNDFYLGDDGFPHPMGNLQLLGKLLPEMITRETRYVPQRLVRWLTDHSVDWWIMSEDLPVPENRVTLDSDERITVSWSPRGLRSHRELVARAKRMMRRAGYRVNITRRMGIATVAHQCGTVRFGTDPTSSVLDPYCRSHDVENLYVVDASFFPSSSAMNPALTVAAQALRVGAHMEAP
ncbi:MAG: GMC family oxidoreductase [Sciscionella sp.]